MSSQSGIFKSIWDIKLNLGYSTQSGIFNWFLLQVRRPTDHFSVPNRHRDHECPEHRWGFYRRLHDRHCFCKVYETHPSRQDGPVQQERAGDDEERGVLPAVQGRRPQTDSPDRVPHLGICGQEASHRGGRGEITFFFYHFGNFPLQKISKH